MGSPVRLQLSRVRGFDLQAMSRARNGLAAVNVSRPGLWGNPFVVSPKLPDGTALARGYVSVPTAADAKGCYALMLQLGGPPGTRGGDTVSRLPELRGKNLACWCKPEDPCHADVLLRLANAPPAAHPRTSDPAAPADASGRGSP